MWWNKKLFPSLNVINGKAAPYGSEGFQRHYHYRSDPNLGLGIVAIRRIPWSFQYWKTIFSLSWDSIIKEVFNHLRYGIVNNCRYYQIRGYHNIWILFEFLMMEQMNNIKNTLIEPHLMVMWWTCLWSLWK